jgi:hypothetical protein
MSERKVLVDSSRRVDIHAFVEVGVQVGSRLCSYGSAGRQPRGWHGALSLRAPDQPIVASHRSGCPDHSREAHEYSSVSE